MEYRKIAQPDEALCAFCRRQKTYYALARQQVTPEYIAMDFQAPPGFSKDRHSHYEIFQDGVMIAYLDYYDGYRYSMRNRFGSVCSWSMSVCSAGTSAAPSSNSCAPPIRTMSAYSLPVMRTTAEGWHSGRPWTFTRSIVPFRKGAS